MAIITLEYDGRNALSKKLIDALLLSGAKVVDKGKEKKINPVQKSLQEIKEGKINTYGSVDEMFESILGKGYVQGKNHQTV